LIQVEKKDADDGSSFRSTAASLILRDQRWYRYQSTGTNHSAKCVVSFAGITRFLVSVTKSSQIEKERENGDDRRSIYGALWSKIATVHTISFYLMA
jgi:hypothetical protein